MDRSSHPANTPRSRRLVSLERKPTRIRLHRSHPPGRNPPLHPALTLLSSFQPGKRHSGDPSHLLPDLQTLSTLVTPACDPHHIPPSNPRLDCIVVAVWALMPTEEESCVLQNSSVQPRFSS